MNCRKTVISGIKSVILSKKDMTVNQSAMTKFLKTEIGVTVMKLSFEPCNITYSLYNL